MTPGDDVPMSGAQSTAAIGVERSAPAVALIEHDPEQLACPEHESFPAARDDVIPLLLQRHFAGVFGEMALRRSHRMITSPRSQRKFDIEHDPDCRSPG